MTEQIDVSEMSASELAEKLSTIAGSRTVRENSAAESITLLCRNADQVALAQRGLDRLRINGSAALKDGAA